MIDYILADKIGFIVYAIVLVVLIASAILDWRIFELPIWLYPVMVVLVTGIRIFTGEMSWTASILGAITGLLAFGFLAVFFNGGGGDVIMMTAVGWCLGIINIIYVIFFSTIVFGIVLVVYAVVRKIKINKVSLPYAPSVLIGMVAFVILDSLFHVS